VTNTATIAGGGMLAVATPAQKRVFWAAWSGWMLDGFDLSIYFFVLVPALKELLQLSGHEPTPANIALYGGYLFTAFMVGWASSMFWGWLADRIGRVKVLCLTILTYSICTALCGFANGILMFAIFRFLSGFGVGGEWAAGTPLLQESVPEHVRAKWAGWLHTAIPIGMMLAAAASLLLPIIGWRGMFFVGVLPAFLTIYLRLKIPEPETWQRKKADLNQMGVRDLFLGTGARNTWSAALMMSCVILGIWSSTFWVPTLIISKMTAIGQPIAEAQRLASLSGFLTNFGTLAGCLGMPYFANWIGSRRGTAATFFIGAFVTNVIAYIGIVSWTGDIYLFLWTLPILGFFTNGVFALYTMWLPEMFPTTQRAFGSGFAFSFGRLLGAVGPTVIGIIAAYSGSYPVAITIVSAIYIIGLPIILMAPETANRPLPA
jgi:MFS family permease